ncbi:MAG: GNAT family N-acetyltransferase [Ktedonobacteraceae bacterium]
MHNPQHGLVQKQLLTPADIEAVSRLAGVCNAYEQLDMRADWLDVRPEYFGNMHDYLYYEDDRLVGYLFLRRNGTAQKEVTGIVHPDYRRRGIFSTLLAAAREECKQQQVQKLILICEDRSASGQAFIAASRARHDFSEHKMVLGSFHESYSFDDRLAIQEADMSDLDALITIIADGWGRGTHEVRESVTFNLQEPTCDVYIARFGGDELSCGEPVGCLRAYDFAREIGIYGFVVRPDYRGRGYGRQTLEEVIRAVQSRSQKPIMLEVDTDNTTALNLYRSCGFEVVRTYGYYAIDVA